MAQLQCQGRPSGKVKFVIRNSRQKGEKSPLLFIQDVEMQPSYSKYHPWHEHQLPIADAQVPEHHS